MCGVQNQIAEFYLVFMSFQNKKKTAFFSGIAVFFIVLDRFLKSLALNFDGREVDIISGWLKFNFVGNYNIALSLPLRGGILIFIIIILIMLVVCYFLLSIKKEDLVSAFCMMLIALGAISNLIDRMIYGFVIDYFDVRFFSVLNLADIMITLGVMIFIVFSFYSNKMKSN